MDAVRPSPFHMGVRENFIQDKRAGDGDADESKRRDEECFEEREFRNPHDSQSQVYQEKGNKGRSDAETLVHQPFGNVRPACTCPVPDLGCLGTHELPERTVEHVALIGCTCKKERDDSQQHENTYESYNHSQDEMEALVF